MVNKRNPDPKRPDPDDDFHLADTDEFEALGEDDTDVLEALPDNKEDQGFDPYNNDRVRRAK